MATCSLFHACYLSLSVGMCLSGSTRQVVLEENVYEAKDSRGSDSSNPGSLIHFDHGGFGSWSRLLTLSHSLKNLDLVLEIFESFELDLGRSVQSLGEGDPVIDDESHSLSCGWINMGHLSLLRVVQLVGHPRRTHCDRCPRLQRYIFGP